MNIQVCYLLLLGTFTVAIGGCTRKHSDDEGASESAITPTVAVKIARVHQGTLATVVAATGKTDVLHREKVVSPVSGTLVSLKALEGTAVKTGEVLAIIRPKETQAALTGAEALLRGARTPAERKEAQAALDLAKSTQNEVVVRAGFDGVIAARSVMEGEIVTEDSELMILVDLSTMVFIADVPLQEIPSICMGQSAVVQFESLPGVRSPAVVEAINPRTDLQSQTVRVRLRFSRARGTRLLLKTEMVGVARIVTGSHRNVLIVPRPALLRDDERNASSVVIVGPDSIARVLPVIVGASTDSTVEISGHGITDGTAVVVEGNYGLSDSTRVRW